MGQSHPKCWTGDGYSHTECRDPSGKPCIESGCNQPAGTLWGPHWCPEHDVERLDRISASMDRLAALPPRT